MKLNLGCGSRLEPGYLNVDKFDSCKPDFSFDLEMLPWPWRDGEADGVLMRHSLEHMGQAPDLFIGIMKELYRVLKLHGELEIFVPHPLSLGYLCDPTHVRPVTPQMLQLFDKHLCAERAAAGWPNTPLGLIHDIDFRIVESHADLTEAWARTKLTQAEYAAAADSNFNVIEQWHIILRKH